VSPDLRLTARVLPVNPSGEVLLLQDQDPAHPGILRWGSVGGAAEPGESLVDAALRELREETGIEVAADVLTEAFHRGIYEFSWDGRSYVSDASFFALPMHAGVEVSFDFLEPAEIGNVLAARWWSADDLEADGTAVASELPDLMRAAVAAVLDREGAS
jgi:8-oxo-dGTP pyrophosphatase MutT (NUDIX family)